MSATISLCAERLGLVSQQSDRSETWAPRLMSHKNDARTSNPPTMVVTEFMLEHHRKHPADLYRVLQQTRNIPMESFEAPLGDLYSWSLPSG
ncbi:MAG: hypothetical protein MK110_09975 [Fuerstiella sp.]|nr:hypothetical protein [Fuerstiella sp.]